MSWGWKGWGTEWWSKLYALFTKMGGSPMCFWPPAKEAHPVHSYRGDLTVLFSRGHKTGCDVKSQISNPWSLLQFYSTWKATCICWPWDGLPPKEDRPCCFQLHTVWVWVWHMLLPQLRHHGFCCPQTLSQKGLPRPSTDAYLLSIILNKLP